MRGVLSPASRPPGAGEVLREVTSTQSCRTLWPLWALHVLWGAGGYRVIFKQKRHKT